MKKTKQKINKKKSKKNVSFANNRINPPKILQNPPAQISSYSFESEEERLRKKLESFSPKNKALLSFNKVIENKEAPKIDSKKPVQEKVPEKFYDNVAKSSIGAKSTGHNHEELEKFTREYFEAKKKPENKEAKKPEDKPEERKPEDKPEPRKLSKIEQKEKEAEKIKEVEAEVEKELLKGKYPLLKKDEEIIDSYEIEVDGAKVKVEIRKDNMGMNYNIFLPKISPATATLLDEIRNELISITTVSMQELTDPSAFSSIKERFMIDARNILREKLPNINKEVENFLVGVLMQEMLGLGNIEFLIDDPSLEEIVIPSAKENIRVYSKKHGWLLTNIKIDKEEEIVNYSNIIARRVGRQITVLSPLLDAHLVTGDRVNAVLYPIGTKGNTITVRKFSRDPFTIVDFINNKTCDADVAALLWLAIEFEMNILISGGTGSGKTSFLNACMVFIPPNQRIISIEDTRELMLPEFLYWTPLVTRTSNPEGKGEVSMLDLLVNSLRMRPDRIILGEMRKQQEAMVLFEAMHTGHSVYATVHADTAAETISRLVNPPLSIPPNLLKSVNLNVVMFRDRKRGIRRVLQIAEYEAEKDAARANIVYRWVPEQDSIKVHNESSRFFEDVARNTGMSESEIKKDLEEKKKIISWMVKNNLRSLTDFGKITNMYYKNKEFLLKAMSKNDVKAVLTGAIK